MIRRGFAVFSHPAFLLDEQHENRAEPPAPWDAIKEYGLCGTLLLTFQQPCGLVRPFRFTLASKFSGTYQSAVIAAAGYENICVVGGTSAAMGTGILAELAFRLLDAGMSAEEIADALEKEKKKIVVVALVDTLKYLKRGGRISKTAAFTGGVLNIKPVISVTDGEIHLLGKARGSKMGNNLLVQEIDKAGGIDFSKPVLLGYSGLSGALLLKYIEDSRHIWEGHLREVCYTTVGSVIGTHLGPGAVVVAFFKNQYNAEQNSSD